MGWSCKGYPGTLLDISLRSLEEILLLKRDDNIEIMKAMKYIEDCWYERRRVLENLVISEEKNKPNYKILMKLINILMKLKY